MRAHFSRGNRLTLLAGSEAFFPALHEAIAGARHEVHLETYIFADDETGRLIAGALVAAAARGVLVRLLVDGFGSREFVETQLDRLRKAGVQMLVYRPDISPWALRRRRLRRLHRKLAVIDRCTAFIGGINISDDVADEVGVPRLDYAVRVEGPLLAPIQRTASRMWEIVSWVSFRRRYRLAIDEQRCATRGEPVGQATAALVLRDNVRRRHDIEDAYLEAIAAARHEILIANAYFLPGRRFRRELLAAAARGVRVRLLLQGRAEYRLQYWATQALYGHLLAGGVRIFEYRASFLHAKVALVDEAWTTVGSSNIDPFSLLMAKEANVVSVDRDFAAALRAHLEAAIAAGAREILRTRWQRFSIVQRALRWTSYQLIRLAVGITGYLKPGEE
jgi:cardiolipin synthase